MLKPQSWRKLAPKRGSLVLALIATLCGYLGYRLALHQGYVLPLRAHGWSVAEQLKIVQLSCFVVGLLAVVRRVVRLTQDRLRMRSLSLTMTLWPSSATKSVAGRAAEILDSIDRWPLTLANADVTQRLRDVFRYLVRADTTQGLADELRHNAARHDLRRAEWQSWQRLAITLVVLMGLLATLHEVRGVLSRLPAQSPLTSATTQIASTHIAKIVLDHSLQTFSMLSVLVLAAFLTRRLESHAMSRADHLTKQLVWTQFGAQRTTNDPQLATLKEIAHATMSAVDQMTIRQTQLWKDAWSQWHDHWNRTLADRERAWTAMMERSVCGSIASQHERFLELEQTALDRMAQQDRNWLQRLQTYSERWDQQQAEFHRQAEIMRKVLEATGEIQSLEKALNQNLRALSGAKNFEDTVMSLSAAIQLLSTRLGRAVPAESRIQLQPHGGQERAA